MTKGKIIGLVIVTCIVCLGAIISAFFKYPTIKEVNKFEIISLKDDLMEVKMTALVNNSNFVGATLNKVESKIFIDGEHVGNGKTNESVKIKASGDSEISIVSNFSLLAFSKLFKDLMKKKSKSTVKIEGKYNVKLGFKSVNLEVTSEEKMDVKKQVINMINSSMEESGFKIKKIVPKKVSLKNLEMKMDVEVSNDFPFDYTLKNIDLELFIGKSDKAFGNWKLDKAKKIKANTKDLVKGDVVTKNLSVLGGMSDLFFGKNKTVRVKGTAKISISGQSFNIPIKQSIPISKSLF